MSSYVYDTYGGLTFGADSGTTPDYGLVDSPGLNDLGLSGTILDGSSGDGAAVTPLWADARRWTTRVEIVGTDAADFDTKRDALLAATSLASNRFAEQEYVSSVRGTDRTAFARVVQRTIPRDEGTEIDNYAIASLTFAAMDPTLYGDEVTLTFTGSSDSEVINTTGWVPSYRWVWTVPGPVTNPQIASSASSLLKVRYAGTIADGETLVVKMYPRKVKPAVYKIVADADVANVDTFSVGTWCYADMDGGTGAGANRPPQWFPIEDGITVSYSATSGTGGSTLAYRPGYD